MAIRLGTGLRGWALALVAAALLWPALAQGASAAGRPGVVVVLAGGGAKGFAHLAVLRRLERDQVPIARIVGTSMGAVVGGLYASGMSVSEIIAVMEGTDVAHTVLDTVERSALSAEDRAYQREYPSALEFGVRDGAAVVQRGLSDGQRFLALLQRLTARWPTQMHFDDLRIPFRAVATRYSDGAQQVFDHGSLALAIRASMAAPAVFAPIRVDGVLYVDGGLVANIPVQIALNEGAEALVVSYFDQAQGQASEDEPRNAFAVASRMIDILIWQNERRNLAAVRHGDLAVPIRLSDYGFADFQAARAIVDAGEQAVAAHSAAFAQLAARWAQPGETLPRLRDERALAPRDARMVSRIEVSGNETVPSAHILQVLAPLQGHPFSVDLAERLIDQLYASGDFERISYALQPDEGAQVMQVTVTEQVLGANRLRTSLGLSAEYGGVSRFGIGVGYRRPWVNDQGLRVQVDLRLGTDSALGVSATQPLGQHWITRAYAGAQRTTLPYYSPLSLEADYRNDKIAYLSRQGLKLGADLGLKLSQSATAWVGLVASENQLKVDTARDVLLPGASDVSHLQDFRFSYAGARLGLVIDRVDSLVFPTRGHYVDASLEKAMLSGSQASRYRLSASVAHTLRQHHVLHLGANLGFDQVNFDCVACLKPRTLELGGFQRMGAYRVGQLGGDRLVHVYGSYMYRLSSGGLWNQPAYVGVVLESGDAWGHLERPSQIKHSATAFVAVDSKLGDVYFGLARGSKGAANVFLQLGQRFGD